MAAPALNVRVGLLFDEKSLANIERQMRSSGQRLSRIGTDLSLSLSLPLAAFGVTAIKAAGDIESLTLALKSQLGTADAAAKELDKLTEAAKNPGLGVEQAVRGSVRLQGVGFAAEEARQVLIQMGNAIAATGGSAQELDNVTRQFAQMTSKGRVLQEDVSILSENMPGLAQLMQKAFGTQSVEAIRNMGVSGKEFVTQITKAAEALPRVEGGIKNGIGNAMDSLKQSAAKVGLAINEAFDVTGTIETVSAAVLSVAQAFASLDPWAKKAILSIAGIAIATGPLIKVWGTLKIFGSQLVQGWSVLVSYGKALGNGLLAVRNAFIALNAATQAFILIGVTVAVIALVSAFQNYQSELTDAEKAQTSLLNIQKQAADSIQGQKSEVDTLVEAYKAEGTTLKQKTEILNRLNQISPEYFGGLRAGKGDVEALTVATGKYAARLLEVAELSSLNKRLEDIATDLRNVSEAAKPSALQTFGNIVLSGGHALAFASKEAQTFTENSNSLRASLIAEQQALQARATELALGAAATGNLTDKTKDLGAAAGEASKRAKVLKEVLSDVANAPEIALAIGDDADLATIKALENGIRKLVDAGLQPASLEVQNLKSQLDSLKNSVVSIDVIKRDGNIPAVVSEAPKVEPVIDPIVPTENIDAGIAAFMRYTEGLALASEAQQMLSDGTFNFTTGLAELSESLMQNGSIIGAVFTSMGDAIAQTASQGASSFAQLGQAAAGAAAKIVRAYIQQGVAAAVAKALGSSIPFPFNIAAGAAAGGIAAALFTKAIGSIGVKGFARGTAYAPGGTALVGEQGPELINLPRGSQVFPTPQTNQMLSGMGGGNINLGGEFVVKGTDLVLILERTQRQNERYR